MERPTPIHTERLILKVLGEEDAEQVTEYVRRNREFLREWEARRTPVYYEVDLQREMLAVDAEQMGRGQLYKVWLAKTEEPERIIGSVALNNIVRGVFQSCHLGYRLDGAEANKGYLTEALEQVVAHAFQTLRLHRIEANIMPHNARSLRVVEKLGFVNEGLARKYLKINGKWEDHIHMVLLNEALEQESERNRIG